MSWEDKLVEIVWGILLTMLFVVLMFILRELGFPWVV